METLCATPRKTCDGWATTAQIDRRHEGSRGFRKSSRLCASQIVEHAHPPSVDAAHAARMSACAHARMHAHASGMHATLQNPRHTQLCGRRVGGRRGGEEEEGVSKSKEQDRNQKPRSDERRGDDDKTDPPRGWDPCHGGRLRRSALRRGLGRRNLGRAPAVDEAHARRGHHEIHHGRRRLPAAGSRDHKSNGWPTVSHHTGERSGNHSRLGGRHPGRDEAAAASRLTTSAGSSELSKGAGGGRL